MNSNSHPAAYTYSNKGKEQLISVGGIPNSKEVFIFEVDIKSHFFFVKVQNKHTFRYKSTFSKYKNIFSNFKSVLSNQKISIRSKYKSALSKDKINIFSKYQSTLSKDKISIRSKYLVSRMQLKLYWTRHIGRKKLHNGPHCIPKSSASIPQDNNTCSILFIL